MKIVEESISINPPIIRRTNSTFIPKPVKFLHTVIGTNFCWQASASLFNESMIKNRPNSEKNIIKKAKSVVNLIILFVRYSI